ncbi:MAG: phosphotransferase enzyme family protein, partial [Sphingomonadales bacterium]
MHIPLVQEALAALRGVNDLSPYEPIGGGLINYSYGVTTQHNEKIFLQQINEAVFLHPDRIANNLQLIYAALQARNAAHLMAKPLSFKTDAWLFRDSKGHYWRAADFISSKTLHHTTDLSTLQVAVQSFANFTSLLRDLNTDRLSPTLENFHDLSLRFEQFEQAIQEGDQTRLAETSWLIEALHTRIGYVQLYRQLCKAPADFKKRVMHHDAKLSNLLFDTAEQQVVAIADLDTTMPGYFFSDLGDMIRSMAASADENKEQPGSVYIVPEAYETIFNSYYYALKDQLTSAETKLLHSAGLVMIYMQTLRFLTDYLMGDRYYQTNRPGQNKD